MINDETIFNYGHVLEKGMAVVTDCFYSTNLPEVVNHSSCSTLVFLSAIITL